MFMLKRLALALRVSMCGRVQGITEHEACARLPERPCSWHALLPGASSNDSVRKSSESRKFFHGPTTVAPRFFAGRPRWSNDGWNSHSGGSWDDRLQSRGRSNTARRSRRKRTPSTWKCSACDQRSLWNQWVCNLCGHEFEVDDGSGSRPRDSGKVPRRSLLRWNQNSYISPSYRWRTFDRGLKLRNEPGS